MSALIVGIISIAEQDEASFGSLFVSLWSTSPAVCWYMIYPAYPTGKEEALSQHGL